MYMPGLFWDFGFQISLSLFGFSVSHIFFLQPAWMENFVYILIWGGESNCSWSVVYVCVIGA